MTEVGETLRLDDGEYRAIDRVPQYTDEYDDKGRRIGQRIRSYALIVAKEAS